MLRHVLVRGDVEVLEHWLQVDSLDADGFFILGEDACNHHLLFRGEL